MPTPMLPTSAPRADDWRSLILQPARRRLRVWFWSIAAFTLVVVAVGGITRLTRSGLSIVEWRPVTGVLPPMTHEQWVDAFDRYQRFPEYRQLRHGMTVAEFERIFLWEYAHRLLARTIGLVFLLPFVVFWRARCLPPPLMRRALALFGLGALQGALGWMMVKSGLIDRPSVSHYRLSAHLVVAILIIAMSVWLARDLGAPAPRRARNPGVRRGSLRWLTIAGALFVTQIVWGGFVAGLRAGFLYNTFPLMAGQVLPPSGFALDPAWINLLQNQATVQWIHRALGTGLVIVMTIGAVRMRATDDRIGGRFATTLMVLVLAQYLLGVLTLVYGVPIAAAALHQITAVVIAAVWVAAMHHAHRAT